MAPSSKKPQSATPPSSSIHWPVSEEKLKQFIRSRAEELLQDENVSSVGIGVKESGGQSTGEVSIQFTVGKKLVLEELRSSGIKEIPKNYTIDGVQVKTDVLERTYAPAYKVVDHAERKRDPRKVRVDPVVPGVSVAHHKETAGTLGCIVYDRHGDTPYILSNWHVLQGSHGKIGDDVMQPGPHDDNRLQQNRLGRLVRSHLGPAGDAAIASIEDRNFSGEVYQIPIQIEQLGEPELGDNVIKSGRTTGVTYGIVTRIHTVVKLDYDRPVGVKQIGGFEIGPDPAHPSSDGEISKGGDSGSVWIFRDGNKTTNIMAGLHFAGEGPSDPNEHAMACYPNSVFEKLEIALKPSDGGTPSKPSGGSGTPNKPSSGNPTKPKPSSSKGYDAHFLGQHVDTPMLSERGKAESFLWEDSEAIPYTHFSLALNKERRMAFWVAWNIDGGRLKKLSRPKNFRYDTRIPQKFQAGEELYKSNPLDRGHIARRADLLWGSDSEARKANTDSFFFPNIAPQMENYNQSGKSGVWGQLEDAVFSEVDVQDLRVSVFGGPVFEESDPSYRGFQIPRSFYKVLAFVEGGKLKAKAFLLTQNLDRLERLDLDQFRVYQVSLEEIEQRCQFTFPDVLKQVDTHAERLRHKESNATRQPLETVEDIDWK